MAGIAHYPSEMSVAEFFAGKDLFLTGVSGFIGKVLLEKLLVSCPDIGSVFVLVRSVKQKQPIERLQEMYKLPVFDRLRKTNPKAFDKVVPICGDIAQVGLAMSGEDKELLQERVSIVIHAASSVRFDDPLKKATFINVRGTREIMELARGMKKLIVFNYISTSYCNCVDKTIEEKIVKSDYDWRTLIDLAEKLDEQALNILQPKIVDRRPNTYTLTKSVAENVVYEYSKLMPCIIIRPSIVVYTTKEPIAGWMDNLNGPVGYMTAWLSGVMHVVYADKTINPDVIPCDATANGIILATWFKGTSGNKECEVMNSASGDVQVMNPEKALARLDWVMSEAPPSTAFWYPSLIYTTNRFAFSALFLLTHLIPAVLIDAILKICKIDFSMLRVYRKVLVASRDNEYFTTHDWIIKTRNYISMTQSASLADRETFVSDTKGLDPDEFALIGAWGMKKYIFKDDTGEEACRRAQRYMAIRLWVHRITKYTFFAFVCWFLGKFVYDVLRNRLKISGTYITI